MEQAHYSESDNLAELIKCPVDGCGRKLRRSTIARHVALHRAKTAFCYECGVWHKVRLWLAADPRLKVSNRCDLARNPSMHPQVQTLLRCLQKELCDRQVQDQTLYR